AGVLAVGLSDNSVELWATAAVGSDGTCGQDGTGGFSLMLLRSVACSDRSLLYAMRLHWHAPLATLHVAAGTIFNQLLLWTVPLHASACCATLSSSTEEPCHVAPSHRLGGHEGSIYRVVWKEEGDQGIWGERGGGGGEGRNGGGGEDGEDSREEGAESFTLISVSDDRRQAGIGGAECCPLYCIACVWPCSARVWRVTMPAKAPHAPLAGSCEEQSSCSGEGTRTVECGAAHRVLFGHGARLWDAHLDSQVAVTVSEDCMARVWSIEDGRLLALIPAHQ
ncbi:unnamed protein product, partial [Closterium sp. NIES-53]